MTTSASAGVATRTVQGMLRHSSRFRMLQVMDLTKYIRDIPDFPKPGILFKDITPLLAEPAAFRETIDRLAAHYQGKGIQAITGAEARGFLFAAPLAMVMKVPLIPLRKPGRLPYRTHALQYDLEYGSAELQVHIDGFA